jgi:periplasmic protein TonB
MLEHFTAGHRTQRRRRLGPAATLSIVAHVCALAGLIAAASWRVDKLKVSDSPIFLAAAIGPSLPAMGDAEPPPKPKAPKRPRVRVDIAQPEEDREAEPPEESDDGGDGLDDGGDGGPIGGCPPGMECSESASTLPPPPPAPVCGNGQLEPGEQCDDGGRASGDGCSPTCGVERTVVASQAIEGYRISGDPQIAAPDSVRSQMMRKAQTSTTGVVKMCLGADGTVHSLSILRSTGYPEYDQRLTSRMRDWRYRPYQVGGRSVPVCTVVRFIYRMQ